MAKIIDFHSHFNQFPDWGTEVQDFKRLQKKYDAAFVPIIAAHWGKKSYGKQFWQLVGKIKINPDLFLGMAFWLDGNNLKKSFKLVKAIPKSLLKFLKVQSCLDKLWLKNKVYFKIVDLASNLNLPLYIHCTKQKEYVELEAVEKLVAYKPKVVKIIGHMGGAYPKYNKKALQIMLKNPNAYLETSATFHQGTIEASVRTIGSKRLLFGSDFPVLDFKEQYQAVPEAKILARDKQNILLKNSENLLGMKL